MSAAALSRTRLLLAALSLMTALWLLAGCATDEEKAARREHNIYFGWLLGTSDLVAIVFDVGATDMQGERVVRAYVCNGLGGADALAAWFREPVNDGTVKEGRQSTTLTSAGGHERLLISRLNDYGVGGTFTGGDGQPVRYAAFAASDGAGIYDLTLDEDLHFSGTSTNGSTVDAQADEKGNVEGTVTNVAGREIEFAVGSLALSSAEELSQQGLPTSYSRFAEDNLVPQEYIAVLSPGGSYWFGHSGNVRGGLPGRGIIALAQG